MESLLALGLASNIIQIVDFCSRIFSEAKELYESDTGTIGRHDVIASAAKNLVELYNDLQEADKREDNWNRRKAPVADLQLMDLKAETEKVVKEIQLSLEKIRLNGPLRRWQSLRQALSSICTEKKLQVLVDRLDNIRKQGDTIMLTNLRNRANNPGGHRKHGTIDFMNDNNARAGLEYVELCSAIRNNNWRVQSVSDTAAFSEKLDSHMRLGLEQKFRDMLFARLYDRHMADRVENIPTAHST